MLSKKMGSFKKLAKLVRTRSMVKDESSARHEFMLSEGDKEDQAAPTAGTPRGFFAVYVGEERRRFVVPTSYLSHPLFRMLLDKARDEYGFEQRDCLVVPCTLSAFQEALNAIESCNGRFDFGQLVHEFV